MKQGSRYYIVIAVMSFFVGEITAIKVMLDTNSHTKADWLVAIFLAGPVLTIIAMVVMVIAGAIVTALLSPRR